MRRHFDRLKRQVEAVFRNDPRLLDQAEDLTQEGFSRLLQQAARLVASPRFEEANSLFPWLWRVTFRKALDLLRRADRHENLTLGDHAEQMATRADGAADLGDVRDLVERYLNPEQAAIFFDHYFDRRDAKDVAKKHGLTVAKVNRILHEGRKLLRRALAEREQPVANETIAIARAVRRRAELDTPEVRALLDRIRHFPVNGWQGVAEGAWRQLQRLRREVSDGTELAPDALARRLADVLAGLQAPVQVSH
jgi:RNA polymerase sigma factor (sigma-70 family)